MLAGVYPGMDHYGNIILENDDAILSVLMMTLWINQKTTIIVINASNRPVSNVEGYDLRQLVGAKQLPARIPYRCYRYGPQPVASDFTRRLSSAFP